MIRRSGQRVAFKKRLTREHRDIATELGFVNYKKWNVIDVRRTTYQAIVGLYELTGGTEKEIRPYLKAAYKGPFEEFRDMAVRNIPFYDRLYAHQKEALFYIFHQKDFFLFFEQGLGKSVTALSAALMLGMDRVVIVCPSVMKYQWVRDQVDKWGFDELEFTVLDRESRHTVKGFWDRFIIVNYEQVVKFKDELLKGPLDMLIVDEAHNIKNHNSDRHKAIKALRERAGDPRTLLLTGTPITNRVNDVFAYHKLIGHPMGSDHKRFLERYTKYEYEYGRKRIKGAKNKEELRTRIRGTSLRKRTEEAVDLPPIIPRKYYIEEEALQDDIYFETLKEMSERKQRVREIDQELMGIKGEKRRALMKERNELMMGARANINTINKMTAIAKTPKIVELVDDLWAAGRKCVVFSPFRVPLKDLRSHYGDKASLITGDQRSAFEKEKEKNAFLYHDDRHVMLANVVAGGVGINMTNCRDVIFCGLPFTPDKIEQPYKRVHRIGQDRTVNVYFVMARGSIDDHIYSTIESKAGDIQNLMDAGHRNIDYDNIDEELLTKIVSNAN